MNPKAIRILRALGADIERLPDIPQDLADYIADLAPTDIGRIRNDEYELERIGLVLPKQESTDR